jgi:ATP-dependent helicase/nuclease subunit A
MVRSALASDAVRLPTEYPHHHRDLYVAAPVGERVIEGYVDLLIETADRLVVVVWTTGTVASEADVDAKLATYELQGAAYTGLETATGLSVDDVRFVFCRRAGAVERRVVDLEAIKKRVGGFSADQPQDARGAPPRVQPTQCRQRARNPSTFRGS